MAGVPHGAIFLSADPGRLALHGSRWRSPATDAASAHSSVHSPFSVPDYQHRAAAAQHGPEGGFYYPAAELFERHRGASAPAGGVPSVASAPSLLQSPPQRDYSMPMGRRVLTSATAYPPWADEVVAQGSAGDEEELQQSGSARKRLRTHAAATDSGDGRHSSRINSPQSAGDPALGSNPRHDHGELACAQSARVTGNHFVCLR